MSVHGKPPSPRLRATLCVCSLTLSCARDNMPDGNNWLRYSKIDAGPGMHVKFEFEMLDMGQGDILILSDGEANTRLSECGGTSGSCPQMAGTFTGVTTPRRAYVSSSRHAYVTMKTDSKGTRLQGFRLRISCVCADSERWTATQQSSGCARFAKGAHQSLHSTCEAPPGGVAAQGVVRPWTNSGQSAHLALPAAVACPKACGKCDVDPCQHLQCQHGGQCVNMVTGAHGACQSLEQFTSFETAINSACCDEPGEKCAGGAPQSCNSGCAKVFLPGYRACSGGFLKKHRKGYEAIKKTMDHVQQLCHNAAGGGHRRRIQHHIQQRATCACTAGWTGAQCQTQAKKCVCANGRPKAGAQCPENGAHACSKCSQGHVLNKAKTACEKVKKCLCANGGPRTGAQCRKNGAHACAKCHNGYVLNKARTACEHHPCHGVNCKNKGKCIIYPKKHTAHCKCVGLYTGNRCENANCCTKCYCKGGCKGPSHHGQTCTSHGHTYCRSSDHGSCYKHLGECNPKC
eukprot:SAG25_NODE_159_length_13431_cov_7.038629_8_plen_516_part_00